MVFIEGEFFKEKIFKNQMLKDWYILANKNYVLPNFVTYGQARIEKSLANFLTTFITIKNQTTLKNKRDKKFINLFWICPIMKIGKTIKDGCMILILMIKMQNLLLNNYFGTTILRIKFFQGWHLKAKSLEE